MSLERQSDERLEGSLSGTIEQGNDVDYFRIDVTSYGTLTVYTTGTLHTVGVLRDNNRGSVLSTDGGSGSGTNFRIEHSSLHPGFYFVQVEGYESNTGDYTLHATFEPRYGAIALGLRPNRTSCQGVVWGFGVSTSAEGAESRALDECRRRGGGGWCTDTVWSTAGYRCLAYAVGDAGAGRCGACGGHASTRSAAEEHALATCRDRGYSNCRIVSDGRNRASACSSDS